MNKAILFLSLLAVAGTGFAFQVEQVFRPERYSRGDTNVRRLQAIDEASWIWMAGLDVWGGAIFTETRPTGLETVPSYFVKFRKDFAAVEDEPLEIDVSADERYVLLLDGQEISRGPHRGLANRWHYQSYRIGGLAAGEHRLEAVCWQLGEHAPLAQVTLRGGFILKASGAYDAALTTGKADWQVGRLVNTRMTKKANMRMFGVGSCCAVTGTSFLDEEPSAWTMPKVVRGPCVKVYAGLVAQGWMLFPTVLHDMMFELKTPGRIVRGTDVLEPGCVIAPHTTVEAIWDLADYYCAYPFVETAGGKGATITWKWTECLTDAKGQKGDRSAWEGLDAYDLEGDVFRCDGRAEARFTTPWWRCGKWCKLVIETGDEPLTLKKVELAETRSPVEMKATFACDDPFVMSIQPLCARVLQVCMHEHFFDCPYYEQQMYPGDSRVQYLVSGLFDTEDRLVRNAITLFDADRRENGMTSFNCPTRGTQEGFGFACCEVMMHGDYAFQHTNRAWLKERVAGMNHTLMGCESFAREDGLLVKTPGWNFVDWVPRWNGGTPPGANDGIPNAEINLQYLMALQAAVKAEEALGETALAAHWRRRAERLSAAIRREFWTPSRSLFASTSASIDFSEHAQCLALLCDVVTGEDAERCFLALAGAPNLDRGTIYYKHYLFSTYFKFGRGDLFFKNLGFWKDCQRWGLKTILENPWIDSRSDCHGWGSHPLWHLHTGVAGVTSDAAWYEKVKVAPHPGHLTFIKSSTPTPKGNVVLDLHFAGGSVEGTVTLPAGLPGTFVWRGETLPLAAGETSQVRSAGAFLVETAKWQRAIDAASAAGGGRVTVPAGRHPVGQLNLRSNVELHLAKDAVLEGVVGLSEYGIETMPCSEGTLSAIVMAQNATNVAVTGEGTVFGNGRSWP